MSLEERPLWRQQWRAPPFRGRRRGRLVITRRCRCRGRGCAWPQQRPAHAADGARRICRRVAGALKWVAQRSTAAPGPVTNVAVTAVVAIVLLILVAGATPPRSAPHQVRSSWVVALVVVGRQRDGCVCQRRRRAREGTGALGVVCCADCARASHVAAVTLPLLLVPQNL